MSHDQHAEQPSELELDIREVIASYFRHTLRVDLDEDIPACAADIMQLINGARRD